MRKDFDDLDKLFNRTQKIVTGWFIFVALLALSLIGGAVYVIYSLLAHFGIL